MTLTTVYGGGFCLITAKINALSATAAACTHFRDTVGGQCNGGFLGAFEKASNCSMTLQSLTVGCAQAS